MKAADRFKAESARQVVATLTDQSTTLPMVRGWHGSVGRWEEEREEGGHERP